MARQKKWNSEAERLAAYRERKTPEPSQFDPEEDPLGPGEREFLAANVIRASELPDTGSSRLPSFPKNRPAPLIHEYVADAIQGARLAAEARDQPEEWKDEAIASAERYARWRHAGYLAGEIARL